MHTRFNQFFERAPLSLLNWRWLVISLFVLVTAFMISGMMTRFTMDMALESWFQEDDPAKTSLEKFRRQFGSDDGIYLVYRTADGDVFSDKSLRTLRALHEALDDARVGVMPSDYEAPEGRESQLSRVERIDSLHNIRYQIARGDTLISKKLIGNEFPETESERQYRRDIALGQEHFKLAYFSDDFLYGGIRLKTDFGTVPKEGQVDEGSQDLLLEDDFEFGGLDGSVSDVNVAEIEYENMQMEEYIYFMEDLRYVTELPEFEHFEFYFTGNGPLMEFVMNNMEQAAGLLGLMVIVVLLLLFLLFRSFSAMVWPIVVICASAFWSIGIFSWLGITMSNMVSLTFMLIVAVGVADCVHVLSAYIYFREHGKEHRPALAMAYRKTGMPIFLTTVTTMCGMSALALSDIPQIGVFGMMSALGVLIAFILTVFVLPVMLDIWHPFNEKKVKKADVQDSVSRHWLQPILDKVPPFVGRHAKTVVICYFAVFAMFLFGTTQVRVDSNLAELTKEGSDIRVTYDIVDLNMTGAQNMEFMLNFGVSDAVKDPRVLKVIDALQTRVETEYPKYVVKTFSIANLVKDTNKVMHEGRAEYEVIPDDARLAAQLLYLFDSANSKDRRNLVSDDYAQTHISIFLRNAGSYEYSEFFDAVQRDIETAFAPLRDTYPQMELRATGSLALMMELVDHISWTQIKSFTIALCIITVLLIVTLGSLQAGLISMVPNLLPAFFTFGVMGLLDIPLDTDTLIIAPLIIGIAVDDTIHFVAHYRDAWYECGDVDQALKSTISEVGQAVTFTTLILGVGFSVLAFSDYLGIAKTGIFGSLAIFVALSSDLFLLPALIKWLKPDLGRTKYIEKLEGQPA